jgi:hypothetical protein
VSGTTRNWQRARLDESPQLLPPCCRIALKPVAESVAVIVEEASQPGRERHRKSNDHSRQQLEGDLVSWPDDAEMATIEGRDFGGVEPLRRSDHRGVDGAERQVAVFGDELGDADRVAGMERLDREAATGQIAEEADLGLPAETRLDQVGDLGDDEGGDDERAGMGLQQLEAGGVVGVVGVDVGVEGPCVDN